VHGYILPGSAGEHLETVGRPYDRLRERETYSRIS
jgi:hypothetical protein